MEEKGWKKGIENDERGERIPQGRVLRLYVCIRVL